MVAGGVVRGLEGQANRRGQVVRMISGDWLWFRWGQATVEWLIDGSADTL